MPSSSSLSFLVRLDEDLDVEVMSMAPEVVLTVTCGERALNVASRAGSPVSVIEEDLRMR